MPGSYTRILQTTVEVSSVSQRFGSGPAICASMLKLRAGAVTFCVFGLTQIYTVPQYMKILYILPWCAGGFPNHTEDAELKNCPRYEADYCVRSNLITPEGETAII